MEFIAHTKSQENLSQTAKEIFKGKILKFILIPNILEDGNRNLMVVFEALLSYEENIQHMMSCTVSYENFS